MNRRTKVYISGPYTKPDPVANTRKAADAWQHLWSLGFAPFCPHVSLLLHLINPMPIKEWYKFDFEWLAVCDVLLRIPGESIGSDNEVEFAKANGIPVVYSIQGLLDWEQERVG